VKAWADLSRDEQELFARYMEVYAAMVDNVDQSLGHLLGALRELGELDNTIVVFTSDNGASREGGGFGTTEYFRTLVGGGDEAALATVDLERQDLIGGPQTLAHYPRGWAMVSNTPFRLYKRNAHAGGHTVPFVVSWPARLTRAGEHSAEYVYVTDVLPTLLEMAGVAAPATRQGVTLRALDGVTFAPVLFERHGQSSRREQYTEIEGHRGMYRDGWEVVTLHQPRTPFGDHEWELYDLRTDPTETADRAREHPDRVRALADAWEVAAHTNQVFPLNDGSGLLRLLRPPTEDLLAQPVRILPGTPTLERYRSYCLIRGRAFRVEIDVDAGPGDQGMLVAHGDQGGGYAVYLLDDEVWFAYNEYGVMRELDAGPSPCGPASIVLDMAAPGGGVWWASVDVDGQPRGELGPLAMLAGNSPFQGIDVGADRRSPVSWALYERFGPFAFSGNLRSVTYVPRPLASDNPVLHLDDIRREALRYE
jgi:arylsulfatase